MSVWGKRETYGMVSATVIFWVTLSALAHVMRPLIPEDVNEDAAASGEAFVKSARLQQIRWRPMTDQIFAESARTDKPILLLLGTGFSSLGAKIDGLLAQEDVAASVDLNYIPVRIDLEREPGWKARFSQVERSMRGDSPWFQLLVMNFKGEIVRMPQHSELWQTFNNPFYDYLNTYGEWRVRDEPMRVEQLRKAEEFDLTGGVNSGIPATETYIDRLLALGDSTSGGFSGSFRKVLRPQDFLLLYEAGRFRELQTFFGPILRSSAVDVLDGGFFLSAETASWDTVEYEKVTSVEADLLELLALFSRTDEFSRYLAEQLFDRLVNEAESGEMASFTSSLKDDAGRSLHYSFSPTRMRREGATRLTPRELTWAEEVLGLQVGLNPQMSCRIIDPKRFLSESDMREKVLSKFEKLETEGKLVKEGQDLLYPRAYVVARLLAAAPDLGKGRSERALSAFAVLVEDMRSGLDDVYGTSAESGSTIGTLVDYLCYADAALQAHRINRDPRVLADGKGVLERGLFLNQSESGGLMAGRLSDGLTVIKPLVPEVIDSEVPSTLSYAARLLADYSEFATPYERESMLSRARGLLGYGGASMDAASHGFSGMARASLRVERAMNSLDSRPSGLDMGGQNRP